MAESAITSLKSLIILVEIAEDRHKRYWILAGHFVGKILRLVA